MKNRRPLLVVFLMMAPVTSLSFLSAPARAQTTSPAAAPGSVGNPSGEAPPMVGEIPPPPPEMGAPTETPSPAPVPAPVGGEQAITAIPITPAMEDRITAVEAKADGLDESLSATRAIVDRLNRIKVGGYIQGRFQTFGNAGNGVSPAARNQFQVRRGRLKTIYDGVNAEYLLELDASIGGVTLKDAEATFVDTWSPFGFRLTLGQFKVPFGYEILQSSGEREMPERSLVIRTLFPGERDRGMRLTARYEFLRVALGLINGFNGLSGADTIYGFNDQNTYKDLVGRIGGDFEWLVVGLSGYFGRTLATTVASTKTSITGADKNMDGAITPDELSVVTTAVPASYRRYSTNRFGADARVFFDVPELGGLALKGELVFAKLGNLDAGAIDPATTRPIPKQCYDVTSIGWIVTVVQNIGDHVGAVVRIDSYDPNYSKAIDSTCPAATLAKGRGDRVTTYGGGLLIFGSANIKASFIYEHLDEQSNPISNDVFTAQLQARY